MSLAGKLRKWISWSPRVFGLAVCLFVTIFALDAFSGAKPVRDALPEFLVHLTPAALLLTLIVFSWRREWVGGLGFIALGVVYATLARGRLDWVLAISGPLLLVGSLFLWNWRLRARRT